MDRKSRTMQKALNKYIEKCIEDPKYSERYYKNYDFCNSLFEKLCKQHNLKCKFSTYNTFEEEHAETTDYSIRINNLVLLSSNFSFQKLENIIYHEMAHYIVDTKCGHCDIDHLNDDELEEYWHQDPRWRQKFVEIHPRFTCDDDIENDEWVDFDEEFNCENLKKNIDL